MAFDLLFTRVEPHVDTPAHSEELLNGTQWAVACRTCLVMETAQPNLDGHRWFALRVRSRTEQVVATMARNKGFEEFVPFYRCRRRWSDRVKTIEAPLFPGYVFCRLDPIHRLPLLTIPGAMHFVGIGNIPAPIEDGEIAAIQTAVASGLAIEPWAYLQVGDPVRLEEGPLAGLEGILIDARKQQRIVVSVSLLQRSIAVEIEREWVTPLAARKRWIGVQAAPGLPQTIA